jgi:phage gpG-like protein
MGLGFTSYSVDNDEKLASAFIRAGKQSKNLKVPLAQIAKDFMKSRKAIFALKGPGQYPDLSSKYKPVKEQAVGFVYPILKLTGDLESSVTDKSHPDNVLRINTQSLTMGTTLEYANAHQEGIGVPLRRFLFVGPESVKFANSEISGFPERALNTLNTWIMRDLGLTMEQATGVKPKIKKGKAKL